MYQTLGQSLGMLSPQAAQKSLPAVGAGQLPPNETNVPHAAFPTLQQRTSAGTAPSTPQFASFPQPVGYGYDGALEQPRQKNQLMQALARMG